MAVPTIRSYTLAYHTTGRAIAFSRPQGAAIGDVLLAFVVSDSLSGALDGVPGEWRAIATGQGGYVNTGLYWKAVGPNEPAEYLFYARKTGGVHGALLCIQGGAPAQPVNVSAVFNSSSSATTTPSPGLTTTGDGCLILRFLALNDNADTPVGYPLELTPVYEYPQPNANQALFFETAETAGAVPDRTLTHPTTYRTATTVALHPPQPPGNRYVSATGAYAPIKLSGARLVTAAGLYAVLIPSLAPILPSGFTATPVPPGQIDLTWTDNATDETGYDVERSVDGVVWSPIAGLPADSTHYSDTDVVVGLTYHYRLRVTNGVPGDWVYAAAVKFTDTVGYIYPLRYGVQFGLRHGL